MSQKWIANPKVTGVEVNHGEGKNVVTGVVEISFTDYGRAFVDVRAHHNDTLPAVTYRDREYLASIHAVRNADTGEWSQWEPENYDVKARGAIGSGGYAPPTVRAAITAAMVDAVARTWTPEYDRQAAYAHAAQELNRIEPDREKLAAELAAMDAKIERHRQAMKDNAPANG